MSSTVDFGIDLGTTNSVLARMTPKGVEIVPIRRQNYLPSAVAVDKRGDLKVGADAINPQFAVARAFKRLMGTENKVELDDAKEWTPEELSAEVLKNLKAAAKLKTDEELTDVVVTIPAMFTQPQCEATIEAAKLAGLNVVALLQEPIAAASAYLSETAKEGRYLVYDLGGGTFDVSLVRLQDGEMTVLDHGGDNYLGGADFDRAVFEWVLGKVENPSALRPNRVREQVLALCEEARISLSDEETATIYLDDFEAVPAKLELTRPVLEGLIADLVDRTVAVAMDRIRNGGIKPSDLVSILLVGGPTQMPYLRRALRDAFGTEVDISEDPMTVVAKGAAIHASTILRRTDAQAKVADAVDLQLIYDPVSSDTETLVAGRVTSPVGFQGEVRLSSSRGDWETGWVRLTNGAFGIEVSLPASGSAEYEVQVRDASGTLVPCQPDRIAMRLGIRAAQPVAPYNYSVVLEGGESLGVLIPAGTPLPASGSQEFRLGRPVRTDTTDKVPIHFVEGLSTFPEENIKAGMLELSGAQLRRTLREDERIEVRLQISEKREIRAVVHIPRLDEEYVVRMQAIQDAADYGDLSRRLLDTRLELEGIDRLVEPKDEDMIIRIAGQLDRIEGDLEERVQFDEVGEAERVHKQLCDTQALLRPLLTHYGVRARYSQVLDFIDETAGLAQAFEEPIVEARVRELRGNAEHAFELGDKKALDGVHQQVSDIFWPMYLHTSECWENLSAFLRSRADGTRNPIAFLEHVRAMERAAAVRDIEGARIGAAHAFEYLPPHQRGGGRFADAVLRS